MEALRQYSPSDEESLGNDSKSASTKRVPPDSSSSSLSPEAPPKSPESPSPPQPRRKQSPSGYKRRSRSPRPFKQTTTHPRRRSRSPNVRRSRSPPSRREGSSYYRRRGRSPSPRGHRHHRRYSPPSHSGRRDSSGNSRYNEDRRQQSRAGDGNMANHPASVNQTKPQWSNDDSLTPEQKLEQALATAKKPLQTQQPATVPGLPSYINPAVINAKHFKSVQEKRKLLWGGKGKKESEAKPKESWNKWESASFEGDDKGETQMKFRRLMGIKDGGDGEGDGTATTPSPNPTKKTNKLLDDLEAQYETSRFMTHLAKGAGLGYGSNAQITQTKINPNDTDDVNESSSFRH